MSWPQLAILLEVLTKHQIIVVEDGPMHCNVFCSTPHFHSPDASNTNSVVTAKSISRHCEVSPGRGGREKSPPVENPCTSVSELVLLSRQQQRL